MEKSEILKQTLAKVDAEIERFQKIMLAHNSLSGLTHEFMLQSIWLNTYCEDYRGEFLDRAFIRKRIEKNEDFYVDLLRSKFGARPNS